MKVVLFITVEIKCKLKKNIYKQLTVVYLFKNKWKFKLNMTCHQLKQMTKAQTIAFFVVLIVVQTTVCYNIAYYRNKLKKIYIYKKN